MEKINLDKRKDVTADTVLAYRSFIPSLLERFIMLFPGSYHIYSWYKEQVVEFRLFGRKFSVFTRNGSYLCHSHKASDPLRAMESSGFIRLRSGIL